VILTSSLSKRKRDECLRRLNDRDNFIRILNSGKGKLDCSRENLAKFGCSIKSVSVDENDIYSNRAPQLFMGLFFILAFVDYILLKVTDEEAGYSVPKVLVTLADFVFFYGAVFFMICAVLANWTRISFAFSEKAYLQGLLIVSVVGFIVLSVARKLRPPEVADVDEFTGKSRTKIKNMSEITWHKYHDWKTQVDGIVLVVVVIWVFLVFFFVISVAAFAEFSNLAVE